MLMAVYVIELLTGYFIFAEVCLSCICCFILWISSSLFCARWAEISNWSLTFIYSWIWSWSLSFALRRLSVYNDNFSFSLLNKFYCSSIYSWCFILIWSFSLSSFYKSFWRPSLAFYRLFLWVTKESFCWISSLFCCTNSSIYALSTFSFSSMCCWFIRCSFSLSYSFCSEISLLTFLNLTTSSSLVSRYYYFYWTAVFMADISLSWSSILFCCAFNFASLSLIMSKWSLICKFRLLFFCFS